MDIDSLKAIFVGIGMGILLLAIIASIRNRSVGCGLGILIILLLFFTPFVGGVGLLFWYSRNIPGEVQVLIGKIALACGLATIEVFILLSNLRITKAGNLIPLGGTENNKRTQVGLTFLIAYCLLTMGSDLFYGTNVDESIRRNTIWVILAIFLSLRLLFSFEFREKGFVYRGKVILFSDIEHAEWENSRDKTRLKVKLINKEQEILIKTPWDMNIQIDNYLQSNFPRP